MSSPRDACSLRGVKPYLALVAIIAAGWLTSPARAQDPASSRPDDLIALAGAFGELHHLRRLCEARRESDVWRERMKTLVSLEGPEFELRESMVRAFNARYRAARDRHRACTRRARDEAARIAVQAERSLTRLMAPLGEDEPDPSYIEPVVPFTE